MLSQELQLKLEYLRNTYGVDENDYYVNDAIRQVKSTSLFKHRHHSVSAERLEQSWTIHLWFLPIDDMILKQITQNCQIGSNR